MECFRRFALTGLAVFIYPESSAQVAVVLLLAAIFMVVSEILAPFERPVDMWLYRMGNYVVFASMFLALLLRVDVSNEREQSQEVFSGVIIIAHAVMLLVVVAQGLLVFMGWGDLVEVPGSLKGPHNDSGGDHEKGKSEVDGQPGPGGRLGLEKNADTLVQQEQREKRWETWERVAPTAKTSFFPTPSRRRGSGASSRAGFQSVSPTSSVQRSEKAGTSRGCRSLSPERRPMASGTDVVGNSSGSTADTRVFAYVQAPPKGGERDGFEAAMTAAGFVAPSTRSFSSRCPIYGIQDVVDASARTADISASSRFGKTNSVLCQPESSSSRPSAEEKGDTCASPTQQPDDKARTLRSWSPRQRFRSATTAMKTASRSAVAKKRGLKRTVAGKHDPGEIPADNVTPEAIKLSDKHSLINVTDSAPVTSISTSATADHPRIASCLKSTASSSGTSAPDSRTSDGRRQTPLAPAETPPKPPPTDVRKMRNPTKPSRRTGVNAPSGTKVAPSATEYFPPTPLPGTEDLPLARSSPLHDRKVYVPGWRLTTSEAAAPGTQSGRRGRQQRGTRLETQGTSARGKETEQGKETSRRVGRAAAPGGQTVETGPEIAQNDEQRTAGETLICSTNTRERETEDRLEHVTNTKTGPANYKRSPVGWRSVHGVATGMEQAGKVGTRPRVRDGWDSRYPRIRPSPTL